MRILTSALPGFLPLPHVHSCQYWKTHISPFRDHCSRKVFLDPAIFLFDVFALYRQLTEQSAIDDQRFRDRREQQKDNGGKIDLI